uniref:(northern house mosquito) hypothetical protein n=1 Tax=Culex pipiens TaxID=7175 RepID=A0A8D8IRY6_CULPI
MFNIVTKVNFRKGNQITFFHDKESNTKPFPNNVSSGSSFLQSQSSSFIASSLSYSKQKYPSSKPFSQKKRHRLAIFTFNTNKNSKKKRNTQNNKTSHGSSPGIRALISSISNQ